MRFLNHTLPTRIIIAVACASIAFATEQIGAQMTTIVEESFGGTGDPLNGSSADTFDGAIAAAGGSGTWAAGAAFLDDGTVTVEGSQNAAALNLGSYINDAKGTPEGKFELTMTVSETAGEWISLGFSTLNTPATNSNFTGVTASGVATIIRREVGDWDLDMFPGPLTEGRTEGPEPEDAGERTLTVTLDLTPNSGYDGVANFGTVSWSDSVLGELSSHTYVTAKDFGAILISEAGVSGGTVSALTLKQVGGGPAIQLRIVSNGANLDFEWASRSGKQYDLLSSADPEGDGDPSAWAEVAEAQDLLATPDTNTLTITRPADDIRFYVIREEDIPPPPPVFFDDFETVPDPDWTTGANLGDAGNTVWERGVPVGDLGNGASGPATGANGSSSCFGTNLTAIYGSDTDIYLRSPAIDLTSFNGGNTGTLTLKYFIDTDLAFVDPDVGRIRVLNANNLSEQLGADLTGVNGLGAIGTDWITFSEPLPAEALGETIVLEFQFASNDDENNFGGFYIDEVMMEVE